MGFFDKLFGAKRKHVTQIYRQPKDVQRDALKDIYWKQDKKFITQLQAENNKLRQKELKRQQEERDNKILRDIEIASLKKAEDEQRLEKSKTLYQPWKGVRKVPTLLTKSGQTLGKCPGYFVKTSREGIALYFFAIKVKGAIKRVSVHARHIEEFFENPLNWVTQVKSGIIKSTIDFTTNGKLSLFKDKNVIEKFIQQKEKRDVEVLMMAPIERFNFQKKIADLTEEIKDRDNQLMEAEEKELDYVRNVNDLQTKNTFLVRSNENKEAMLANLKQQNATMTERLASLEAANQGLKLNSVQATELSRQLFDTIEDLKDRYGRDVPQDQLDLAIQKVMGIFNMGIETAKNAQVPTQLTVTSEREERERVEKEAKRNAK